MSTAFDDLQEALLHVTEAIQKVEDVVGPAVFESEHAKISENAKLYLVLEQLGDLGKRLSKAFTLNEDGLATRISDKLDAAEMESASVSFGNVNYTFTPDKKLYASCKKEDQPAMLDWLKLHESGKEIVHETVNPKTLNKFIQDEVMAKGQVPPPYIKMFLQSTLSVRKSR